MNILVAGNKGMLGRDLAARLVVAGYTVKGVDINEVDITEFEDVMKCFKTFGPDAVVNCAAYTGVDMAESDFKLAYAANRDGPENLAKACRELHLPLIHISTDYVFDGDSGVSYREEDGVNPIGVYGCSKWEGESRVRENLKEHIIIRTSWLYGVFGNNFVKTILRLARERDEIRIVSDQTGCPTWTGELSRAILEIVKQIGNDKEKIQWGTYHCCGQGKTTWYEFACRIVEEGRKRESLKVSRIVPIKTEEYPTPARRPAWSVLDCSKIRETFCVELNAWELGLGRMMEEVYGECEE